MKDLEIDEIREFVREENKFYFKDRFIREKCSDTVFETAEFYKNINLIVRTQVQQTGLMTHKRL